MLFCEFRKIFDNTYFVDYLRKIASVTLFFPQLIKETDLLLTDINFYHVARIFMFFYQI